MTLHELDIFTFLSNQSYERFPFKDRKFIMKELAILFSFRTASCPLSSIQLYGRM